MTPRPPRLLFYSHNGVGVGHFRRQLRLAAAFRARHPEAPVLLVTGSHAAGALSGPLGFDFVSLPSIRMVDRYETWAPRQLGLSIDEVMRMRSDLLTRTVRRFRPDLLIADFMPAGPYGELVGALEELSAAGGRAVAGFRDIIDEPGFVRDLWTKTGVYDVLRAHYAAVCVYGAPEVMDFETSYGLGEDLADRLHYSGYLGHPDAGPPRDALSRPAVLGCTGGGVDGGQLLSCFIGALRRLPDEITGTQLVVGGPLLSDKELLVLCRAAAGSRIEVSGFMPDLDRRIIESDLVVTMPGYNSTCELLSGGARAIVVPRAGPSLEQRMRAQCLERWGRARILEPVDLDEAILAEAITTSLQHPPPPLPPVPVDGLGRAVNLLESIAAGEAASVSG